MSNASQFIDGYRRQPLLVVYDLCLLTSLVGVPLTMAGIADAGVAMFVLCSLMMGLTWSLQQLWQRQSTAWMTSAEIVVLLAVGLVGLQLIPLPQSVLSILAPFVGQYLTLWGTDHGGAIGQSSWQTISLTPDLTRSGLLLLLAYAIFFVTLVQRLRDRCDVDRLLKLIGVVVCGMAALGLAQMLFGNGRYLWIIEHPYREAAGAARGTFTNPNHFAGFLALGIGPLVWWWQSGAQELDRGRSSLSAGDHRLRASVHPKTSSGHSTKVRSRRKDSTPRRTDHANEHSLAGAAVAVVLLAGLLSLSRGGIATMGLALCVSTYGICVDWKGIGKLSLPLAAFAVAGVAAAGAGPLANEWDRMTSASSMAALSTGRLQLWSAVLQASAWFWPAGSGLGSHAEVYPTWLSMQSDFRFSHAENGYLQVFLELGLPGLMLLIGGLGLCVHWCRSTWKQGRKGDRRRIVAIGSALAASAAHATVDFDWYIPGCMVLTLTLVAAACRCCQLAQRRHQPLGCSWSATAFTGPRTLAWILLVALIPVGMLAAGVLPGEVNTIAARNSYRKQIIRTSKSAQDLSMRTVDPRLDSLIADLESCLAANPGDHAAATDLASLYLRRFEVGLQSGDNPMTLRQVQDTIKHAGFASLAEQHEWLRRAFGECVDDLGRSIVMARRGLRGQPLRGSGYIVLAETGFAWGLEPDPKQALVQQAVRLRPHDPAVLYSAGSLAADAGDMDRAFVLWKQACEYNALIRRDLIQQLTATLPATELNQLLTPDADGLWLMFESYGRLGRPADQTATARLFTARLSEFARSDAAATSLFWLQTHDVLKALGHESAAVNCLKEATRRGADDDRTRRQLAFALLESGELEAARRQLDWCRLRNPDDSEVADALERIENLRPDMVSID